MVKVILENKLDETRKISVEMPNALHEGEHIYLLSPELSSDYDGGSPTWEVVETCWVIVKVKDVNTDYEQYIVDHQLVKVENVENF